VARPGFVPGVGPYPQAVASLSPPDPQPAERRALAALYLALMSAAILDLIDSQQCLLVEGPFAADEIFVGALATLRDRQQVYTCSGRDDLAYGALRLLAPALAPPAGLRQVAPIEVELKAYAEDWRRQAEASRRVA
jgi:hypothetical protein